MLAGPSLSILFSYDLSQFPDSATYLGLAEFDLDQSPVRRYRIIIPFLASALNFIFGSVFEHLSPGYFKGDFSLAFSFFIVNIILMSLFGVLCYRYCRAHLQPPFSALIGLLVVLTARYTYYFASLPLIDSLVCITVALTLLGIKTRNTAMLITAIFLGPFARESFIFMVPVIFFYSHIPKGKALILFLLSGIFVFSFHYLYDLLAPEPVVSWLTADVAHVGGLIRNLPLLFSFYGWYKIMSSPGIWILLPLVVLFYSPLARIKLRFIFRRYVFLFMAMVLLQMLLSGAMERMFYLAMPVFAVLCGMATDEVRMYFRKTAGFTEQGK